MHSIRNWTLCVLLTLTVALVAPAAMADHVERPSLWSEVWGWVVELLDVGDEAGGPYIVPSGQESSPDDEAGGPYIVPSGVTADDEAGGPYIVPNGFEGNEDPPGDEAGGPYIVPSG